MIESAISAGVVLLITVVCSILIRARYVSKWEARADYGVKGKQWNFLLIASVVIGTVLTVVLSGLGMNFMVATIIGVFAFFLSATGIIDSQSHLVPKELSSMALILGLVLGGAGWVTQQYYVSDYLMSHADQLQFQLVHFGIYMVAISLLFVVTMFQPVIGFGDIKMFWAFGLFAGSFIFLQQFVFVFMVMFVVMAAMMVRAMIKAKSWKFSGGLPALPAFAVAFLITTIYWALSF